MSQQIKISDLNSAVTVGVSDELAIVQTGVTKKVTIKTIAELFSLIGWGANVIDEVPSGVIDGINKEFNTLLLPKIGTLQLFLNGMKLTKIDDFTYVGSTITMVLPPYPGDKLIINYQY